LLVGVALASARTGLCANCSVALRVRGSQVVLHPQLPGERGVDRGVDLAELHEIIEARVRAQGAALMGVLNTTPDSFFDGGRFLDASAAEARVDALLDAGATIIDIGAESTRPGAEPVPPAEQIRRAAPALDHAERRGALVSIDTMSPEVAEFAVRHGAKIVNDVSCLRNEGLADVAARHGAALIVMHSRASMTTMPGFSQWPDAAYQDVVAEVRAELAAARDRALARGVPAERIFIDPGLGFSKNARHSFELLGRLPELATVARILVVGPSRKSFIAAADPSTPAERLPGTIAACLLAAARGAQVLRVHDVPEVRQALAVAEAARRPAPAEAAHAG